MQGKQIKGVWDASLEKMTSTPENDPQTPRIDP
jgi:hypothetical protein